MLKELLKKISKVQSLVITLLLMQPTLAAPKGLGKLSLAELNVAILDLNASGLAAPSIVKNSTKAKIEKYPSNCLKWNTEQIKRKAKRFDKTINKYSRMYRVDANLIKSVITVESCFKVKALSSAGAQGLMQLIPATAERFGVRKSYNAQQNIRGGVKYLKFLTDRFKGDLKKVLAAYNAGEGAVDKYMGIPPYKETQHYVKNVLKIYKRLKPKKKRVKAVYHPPKKGQKPGRHGWQYNRSLAPHLYKQ